MRRDHGLPFRHPYFRLDESSWLISEDPLGLALVMIRTPYTRNRPTPKLDYFVCLILICYRSLVFYLFVTVLWRTRSNIYVVGTKESFICCLFDKRLSKIIWKSDPSIQRQSCIRFDAIDRGFIATPKSQSPSLECLPPVTRLWQWCKEKLCLQPSSRVLLLP
jgi:hypothetical protein